MATLFERSVENARILDPGAGVGVLFASLVSVLISNTQRPRSIEVVAYENDGNVLSHLQETMLACKALCDRKEISFQGKVCAEDFIASAVEQTEYGLFAAPVRLFTHVTLNPPYKKVNSHSETRKTLAAAGIEVSNLYAAFTWLAARLLETGGEMVAITPRSFCNGPYFRRFRKALLDMMSLHHVHIFESRKKAFADDSVLQENVIFHAVRGQRQPKRVTISVSQGSQFSDIFQRNVPFGRVVFPGDSDSFIHLVQDDEGEHVMRRMARLRTTLFDLGLDVSTGRVVDFRAKEHLRSKPSCETAPLIYPCHFESGFVRWPLGNIRKPNAILASKQTRDLLVRTGYYVLAKRFTAKEEPRRVVAAIFDPDRIKAPEIGFENHLNYFHAFGKGLPPRIAKGLALFLNSSLFDKYFRLFSGHTQVNATDLRKMRYPTRESLLRLGENIDQRIPDQETVDDLVNEECERNG